MEGEKDGGAGNGVDWGGSRGRKCGWGRYKSAPHWAVVGGGEQKQGHRNNLVGTLGGTLFSLFAPEAPRTGSGQGSDTGSRAGGRGCQMGVLGRPYPIDWLVGS